jgi:hypothetical protein
MTMENYLKDVACYSSWNHGLDDKKIMISIFS